MLPYSLRVRSAWCRGVSLACAVLCVLGGAGRAGAEDARLGASANAVPGYLRVPVPSASARGALVSAEAGYGFTESQVEAPGDHHRMGVRVGAVLTPIPSLDVALLTRLRHDTHSTADELGSDRGTVIDSDVYAQAGTRLASGIHLGAGARGKFVRGVDAGRSLMNPALDLTLLAAYVPSASPVSVGALAGFRYDRTADAVLDASSYRRGDRLALDVSEVNALPLGIGGRYRFGATEALAELSADLLIGAAAPALTQSPLRAGAGLRHRVADDLILRVLAETALGARPRTGPADPLLPVEPRFQVLVGVSYALLDWEGAPEPEPSSPPPLQHRAEPPPPVANSALEVKVTTRDGFPLSDATVELVRAGRALGVPHHKLESYRRGELPAGPATLRVSAPRLMPEVRHIELSGGAVSTIEVQLAPAPATGQLRGLVRSFGGQGLQAQIRVEPLGTELTTEASGGFSVEVPPGRYDVVIVAPGHVSQRRRVEVTADGVIILNADLSKAKP